MENKVIKITCKCSESYNIDEFINLQGMLKVVSNDAYERLKTSIVKFGFRFPIFYVLLDGKKYILDGHGRLYTIRRMISEGFVFGSENKLPAVKIEAKDRKEAKEVLLAMNSSYGEMTTTGLYDFLKEDGLDVTDFSDYFAPNDFTFDEMQADFIDLDYERSGKKDDSDENSDASSGEYNASESSEKSNIDEDNEPEIIIDVPVIKTGDIIELPGGHRLMCGSSLKGEDIDLLMNGKLANMMFTDPPYNLAEKNKLVANDVSDAMQGLKDASWDVGFSATEFLKAVEHVLEKDCSVYVCTSHHLAPEIWAWMEKFSDFYSFCVWSKTNPMPSLMKRHWTWDTELICYATRGKHVFNFPEEGHCPSTWRIAKNQKNEFHPTQKPVSIPKHAIVHSSNPGQLVVDFFGGSGCTILACVDEGRICYTMERDTRHCQTIIERFVNLTSSKQITINGKLVDWSEYRSAKE